MRVIPDNVVLLFFKTFPGHEGRPNKRGGSQPRDAMGMPEPRTVKLEVLPAGKDELFYLDRFMTEFDAGRNESVELTDLVPFRRIVSRDLFTNHLTGDMKINVNGRAQYVTYIAETIKRPDEIWIDQGGHSDRTMYCLSRFVLKKETMHIITAFKEGGNSELWVGWSGFQSFVPSYYQSKRRGDRIYVRP
jgi:hypothetical protein